MHKEILLGLLVLVLVVTLGCIDFSPPLTEIPQDLVIEYAPVCGFCPIDAANQRVIFNANLEGKLIQSVGVISKEYNFSVTESELLDVINTAKKNGFFSMNENNVNPNVVDGGGNRITIFMNGVEKKVSVINYDWDNFNEIIEKLNKISYERTGVSYYNNLDLAKACVDLNTLCADLNKDFSCNIARDYCSYAGK